MRFLRRNTQKYAEIPKQKHRTYRVWRNMELPKYFIQPHTGLKQYKTHSTPTECGSLDSPFSIDIALLRSADFSTGCCVCETIGKMDTPLKHNAHETRIVQTLVWYRVVLLIIARQNFTHHLKYQFVKNCPLFPVPILQDSAFDAVKGNLQVSSL